MCNNSHAKTNNFFQEYFLLLQILKGESHPLSLQNHTKYIYCYVVSWPEPRSQRQGVRPPWELSPWLQLQPWLKQTWKLIRHSGSHKMKAPVMRKDHLTFNNNIMIMDCFIAFYHWHIRHCYKSFKDDQQKSFQWRIYLFATLLTSKLSEPKHLHTTLISNVKKMWPSLLPIAESCIFSYNVLLTMHSATVSNHRWSST